MTKNDHGWSLYSCALDLAGTQATGTNVDRFVAAVYNSLDTTDVRFPSSVGLAVGVRNVMTEHNALSAKVTFCHELTPPICCFCKHIHNGIRIIINRRGIL